MSEEKREREREREREGERMRKGVIGGGRGEREGKTEM